MKKLLLTSVCRPLGEKYGDGPSVGYELLFGQVTRAQGLFSPRVNHIHFSLEYIAENLDAPTTVLQYPSRTELSRELAKGYDVVGVSFVLATFHRMKEIVAMIRERSPKSEIVLGGYGTVLTDEALASYGDHICREEGVAFMRSLLGEPQLGQPYRHPLVVTHMRLFGTEVSRSGVVFGGLGCPNGCDFCCTSHFFKRKHIRLLETGKDIYAVIQRYRELEPGINFMMLDEDFLLNKRRAMELRDCVIQGGEPLGLFAFASVKALSQYDVTEILEMGIDGLWIGYEGTRSGFAKQQGRPVEELFAELRDHGISVLASMIVGFPYQTPEIIEDELQGLLSLGPTFSQFLIYGPTPGTPFYQRVEDEGLFREEPALNPEKYYHQCTGFSSVVEHPNMDASAIESAQEHCYDEDFQRLGPSIYRTLETWLLGYRKLKDSPIQLLRKKSSRFAEDLRQAYPIFLAGKVFGPNRKVRSHLARLEQQVHQALGKPTWAERALSVLALGKAAVTGLTLQLRWFQHPRLVRHTFRMPEEARPARIWRQLKKLEWADCSVWVEQRPECMVWVRVEGRMRLAAAEELARHLGKALTARKEHLVLDFKSLVAMEGVERLLNHLEEYKGRVTVALPPGRELPSLAHSFCLIG